VIVTADWHLRSSVPRCRTETEEEWFNTQKRILEFIYSFKEPVYIAGDIFHNYNPGYKILGLFLSFALHNETHIMMGNHDARCGVFGPDSGYGVLQRIVDSNHPYLKSMKPFAWIDFGTTSIQGDEDLGVLFLHTLCFPNNSSAPPGANYVTARELSDAYDQFGTIIVGDNHTHFMYDKGGRLVLSPGCITRQAVDYKDKTPMLFRLQEEGLRWEEIAIPDDAELVNDNYILAEHEREDRYNHLVEALKLDGEVSFDFRSNVWDTVRKNDLSKDTIAVLKEVIPE
jgi:DNA repair exonuclease SbcCD nuclease subunit